MTVRPIGIFDSGYGGLTVMKEIVRELPQYDYLYLGDNARAPYGTRSYETVDRYTWESVQWFFKMNCPLVILACNTASAKALRNIQQVYLPKFFPDKKVLGVIRPTTEVIGNYSKSGKVGVLATPGTVQSESYPIEIQKFFPAVSVFQEACPIWVPLIENDLLANPGTEYFVRNNIESLLKQDENIDTILLGCTHYPLLKSTIARITGNSIQVISQGEIVARSLADYLHRHPEIESSITQEGTREFYTTDSTIEFDKKATPFYGKAVKSRFAQIE